MADSAITGLTEESSPVGTDLLVMVDDPAGTPVTKKVTMTNVLGISTGDGSGWVDATAETWTYASATTFTVSGDVTATYQEGTKLRLKQGGAYKYFYVVSSSYSAPNTTITITGGDDYSLANAAITDNAYSYVDNPQGHPSYFAYTPTISNETSTQPTLGNGTLTGRFTIKGRTVIGVFRLIWGSTTNRGTGVRLNFALPVASAQDLNTIVGGGKVLDSGTQEYTALVGLQTSTTVRMYNAGPSAAAALSWNTLFTPATNDEWTGQFTYEI